MKTLTAAFILLSALPAQALCPQIEALFDGAKSITLPQPFNTTATCTTSLALSGETSTHCGWPFDYRAPQASQAFQAVIQAVPNCLGASLQAEDDQDVNHPDFYDLRLFQTAQGEVGVSLKDKGALQQTYVFLRVTPAEAFGR